MTTAQETQRIARAFVATEIKAAVEHAKTLDTGAALGAIEALARNISVGTPAPAEFLADCGIPA